MSGRTKTRVRGIFGVLMAAVFVLIGSQTTFAQFPIGDIPEQFNWTTDTTWKVKKFTNKSNVGSIKLLKQFKSNDDSFGEGTSSIPLKKDEGGDYYYGQVGVVTEDKYVFLVGREDSTQESYLYFADRTDGKIVKSITGNFGHPDSIYYKWGAHQVNVGGSCYSTNNFEKEDCIVNGPNGSMLEGRFTVQGRASQDSWVAVAGWDAADTHWGQKTYYIRNSNGVILFNMNNMLVPERSLYIGKTAKAGGLSLQGEIEDVSFDDELNLYLFYNLVSFNNGAAFLKIPYDDWHSDPSPDEANDDDGGDTLDRRDYDADIKVTGDKTVIDMDEDTIQLEPVEEGACTSLLPNSWCDSRDGTGINSVVGFVLAIMTGGAAVAGTIGLIVCGIMWMSSRDDEVKVAKAKKRMADIVIGIVVWALIYVLANLVIPRSSGDLEQGSINFTSNNGASVDPNEDTNDPNDTSGDNNGGGDASDNTNPVTSVEIINNKNEIVLEKTGTEILLTVSAKITPSDATNKGLMWSSSDNSIASVDKGSITFKNKPGTVTITAQNRATGVKGTTTINVRKHKMIMIGNSKTNRDNKPSVRVQLEKIFENRKLPISVTSVAPGGTTLYHKATTDSYKRRINNFFDTAILQEKTSTALDLKEFKKGAKAVKDLLVDKNPNVRLYVRQAWATYEHLNNLRNDHQSIMNNNAASVASYIGGSPIEDGRAFLLHKDIRLYNLDSSADQKQVIDGKTYDINHASTRGAYLAALCIYKKVIGGDATKITYWPNGMKEDAKRYQQTVNSYCK